LPSEFEGEKRGNIQSSISDNTPFSDAQKEEILSAIKQNFDKLSKEYGITASEIPTLVSELEHPIPISAFLGESCPLEGLVSYLKEIEGLSLREISAKLGRAYTTIYTTYCNAKKRCTAERGPLAGRKKSVKCPDTTGIKFPLGIFCKKKLSVLESATLYLRDHYHYSYHEIGELLQRDERTVWTTVHRAEVKLK
jgi:hypothetical protein